MEDVPPDVPPDEEEEELEIKHTDEVVKVVVEITVPKQPFSEYTVFTTRAAPVGEQEYATVPLHASDRTPSVIKLKSVDTPYEIGVPEQVVDLYCTSSIPFVATGGSV